MSEHVFRAENKDFRITIYRDEDAEMPRWEPFTKMVYGHNRYILGDEKAANIEKYSNWDDWLKGEVLDPNGGREKVVYLPLYVYDHGGVTMNTTGFSCAWDSGQVGWIYATKEAFRKETGYREDELFSTEPQRTPAVGNLVRCDADYLKDFDVTGAEYLGNEGWGQVTHIEWDDEPNGKIECLTVDFDYNKALNFKRKDHVLIMDPSQVEEVLSNYAEEMLRGEVEDFNCWLTGEVYGFVWEEKTICGCCGNAEYEELDSCWGIYSKEALRFEAPKEAGGLLAVWDLKYA